MRRRPQRSIEPDHFAIQRDVLHDLQRKLRKLFRLTETLRKWHRRCQRLARLIR
jgi:hypothetical protein